MKITNIVTNVVLAVAVAVLFVLHFTGGEKGNGNARAFQASVVSDPSDISIAFFRMDSVMNKWDLYYSYQQDLAKSQSEMEAEFVGKT